MMNYKRIAIFASGSGTNAENIIRFFSLHPNMRVELVLSNKKDAPVLEKAHKYNVKTFTFTKDDFFYNDRVLKILKKEKIDFIVLAGFLWLVPTNIVREYPNRIVNIHPALLPKYGGKGMYGERVHKAVLENEENESGITIHYVNEKYDEGNIILQEKCSVKRGETPESLASKVHELEYRYYPEIIEKLVSRLDHIHHH